jgi:hypothetical protein
MRRIDRTGCGAGSLTELLLGLGISAVAVALLLAGLGRVLDLYARDMGSLVAQEEGRSAITRFETEIRNSASAPLLIDAAGNPIAGEGPAPGLRFARLVGGPFPVHNNAGENSTNIRLRTGSFVPRVGDVLEVPTHGVRRVIDSVAAEKATPTVRNLRLDGALGVDLLVQAGGGGDVSIIAYITRAHTFSVENHELRLRPGARAGSPFDVLARNVESAEPFRRDLGVRAPVPPILIELTCVPSAGLRTRARHEVVVLKGAATARAPWSVEP